LEDVGLIVDGLVGNLQEGAIPVHLQRIIERFESIIQLDLTRRGSSSPWAWPVGGLGLLREAWGIAGWMAGGQQRQQQQGVNSVAAGAAAAGEAAEATVLPSSSSTSSNKSQGRQQGLVLKRRGGGSSSGGEVSSLELALLRPSDVARLVELPAEVRVD
jgi:hypothetical protein